MGSEVYLDFVTADYLSRGGGEVLGGKAGVIADNQPSLGELGRF